jgi:hypothetical protein
MIQLADLQRKIDEAAEEMCHITQDDQGRRPQQRELRQESPINDDELYDDFHHGNFAFDDVSPLAAELQAIPWPPSYKPPQLPIYNGHLDPKQFLMSYEATMHILIWWQHGCDGKILRHGSHECSSDVVFFPSPGNDHAMAKVE